MNNLSTKTTKNTVSLTHEKYNKGKSSESELSHLDNRPEAIAQLKLIEVANNNPMTKRITQFQLMADNYIGKERSVYQPDKNKIQSKHPMGKLSSLNSIQFTRGPARRVGFRPNVRRMREHAREVLTNPHLNFDMAHRMSYHDIKETIFNPITTRAKLIPLIRDLTIPKRNFGPVKRGDREYYHRAMNVINNKNALLRILNSSPFNLRPGDSSTNRSIGSRGDLHYEQRPGLKRTLTPQSRDLEKWIQSNKGESSDHMTGQEYGDFESGIDTR
jgi:hypothetical protein